MNSDVKERIPFRENTIVYYYYYIIIILLARGKITIAFMCLFNHPGNGYLNIQKISPADGRKFYKGKLLSSHLMCAQIRSTIVLYYQIIQIRFLMVVICTHSVRGYN